jgi:hypothetical protein
MLHILNTKYRFIFKKILASVRVRPIDANQNVVNPKKSLSHEEKANTNITRMVLAMLFMFLFGYTPYTIVFILKIILNDNTTWKYVKPFLSTFSYVTLYTAHSSYIIIYYKFDKTFRDSFRKKFHLD